MSYGRGRRDLDGVAGDLAREADRRLADERARHETRREAFGDDGHRDTRPGLASAILGRIRRALGRS